MLNSNIQQNQNLKALQDRQKLLQLADKLQGENAVIKTNTDGQIISWSSGAEKMYGYSEAEAQGQNFSSLVLSKASQASQELELKQRLEEIDPYATIHISKDGKPIYVRMSLVLVKDPTGKVTGNCIIARDVTERRLGAPMPKNEAERLDALYKYGILDTPSEESFDDFTRLASAICKTPIALISLVDAERQWFKSKVGLQISETSRDISFCGYTILQDEVLVVEDVLDDERFFDNPLVNNAPNIRFYAGAPLMTSEGVAIGSLCVIDQAPKKLTVEQLQMLQLLSRLVVKELNTQNKLKQLNVLKKENQDIKFELSESKRITNTKMASLELVKNQAMKRIEQLSRENQKLSNYGSQAEQNNNNQNF